MKSKKLMERFRKIYRAKRVYENALWTHGIRSSTKEDVEPDLKKVAREADTANDANFPPVKDEFSKLIGAAITDEIEAEVK